VDTLQAFAIDCIKRGNLLGVTPANPVKIVALGSDSLKQVVQRNLWLAFDQPELPPDMEVGLWFDPDSWQFYKSTNWKDTTPNWELQTTYETLFDESVATGVALGGQLTDPLYLVRNPQDDNEAATKIYVDTLFASITGGSGSMLYGDPVATVLQLRQLDISLIPDKQIRYVEELNRIFAYDQQSTAVPDNQFVAKPLQNTGRWISTDARIMDSGTF
jgi:hypothetical protein